MDTPNDLLTANEIAKLLATSPATVRRWCNSGWLPAFKLGGRLRISKADALAMLKRVEAAGPMLPTKAEVEAKEKWVDEILRRAKVRR